MGTVKGKTDQIQITISLKENKCISFSLTDYANVNQNKIPFEGYEFAFKSDFILLENEKSARVTLTITLRDKTQSSKPELAELVAISKFFIQNYDAIIKKDVEKNRSLIPDALIGICNNITLSTARGMLSIKLENTPYSEAVVPLLDPRQLYPKKDMT